MKEAFWGTLIIILGLFGIVVINIFQNVTVDNDRVYYLIKESTQAAALDALDLTYYRLNADFRIVEDKFVENLTRRFAENVTIGDYTIIVEDINEMPPKVSLRVRSGITSLNGEEFGILNRVDGIIEAKYNLDEVLDFLDITEEEWNVRTKVDANDNICNVVDIDEPVCIPGDLKFVGFSDATLTKLICHDETPRNNVERVANYKECVCGNWEDKTQTVYANPVRNENNYVYTWTFTKTSNVRTISESIKESVKTQICTTGIQEMVPNDIQDKVPTGSTYEPSSDNSSYTVCPPGGIRIPVGMSFVMHPNYIPPESVNRDLTWDVSDSNVLGIQSSNPTASCVLNSSNSNCFSKAMITAKNVGTSYVNVKTSRGQTSSCKVEVFDGNISELSCEDLKISVGESKIINYKYLPKNSIVEGLEYSISDTVIATLIENMVYAKASGSAILTITEKRSKKSSTCKIEVPALPLPPDTFPDNVPDSSSGGYYKVIDANGNITYCQTREQAEEKAREYANGAGSAEIYYKSSLLTAPEVKYSETVISDNYGNGMGEYEIKIYNGSSTAIAESEVRVNSNGTYIYAWDMKGNLLPEYPIIKPNENVSNNNYSGSSGGSSSGGSSSSSSSGGSTSTKKPSGSGHSCFEEDVEVVTIDGYKKISNIRVGDYVLSYNEKTKENEYKKVTKLYVHKNVRDIVYSILVNNYMISATEAHRFYIKTEVGYLWKSIKDVKINDMVVDSNSKYYEIKNITSKVKVDTFYNFEVEDNHNYYVTKQNILVHNAKVAPPLL